MSEEAIVRNCAPTLAGIKTGNLFSYPYRSAEEMRTAVRHWNRILRDKGVRIVPLRFEKNRALIYVYRPSIIRYFICWVAAQPLSIISWWLVA